MKKFISTAIIIVLLIVNCYLQFQNYNDINNLINYQSLIVSLQEYFNELNVQRNMIAESKIDAKLNTVESQEKPTYEYMKNVTVRMVHLDNEFSVKGWIGTGVIVKVTDDYTYIITNKHVAPIDNGLMFVEKDNVRYKAEVLKNGFVRDLSLVRIVGKIPNTEVVKGFAKVKEQDSVYSVGMYLGLYDIYTEGTVAGNREEDQLMNMPCLSGCSGSGVFDKNGNLVALVYAGTAYNIFGFDTSKAICVPYIAIMTFLEEIL